VIKKLASCENTNYERPVVVEESMEESQEEEQDAIVAANLKQQ